MLSEGAGQRCGNAEDSTEFETGPGYWIPFLNFHVVFLTFFSKVLVTTVTQAATSHF